MAWPEWDHRAPDQFCEFRIRRLDGDGGWVWLRAKYGTAALFGLFDLEDRSADASTAGGRYRVVKAARLTPRRFRRYRIATPDRYASNGKPVGWRFGLSTTHTHRDLALVGEAADRSGAAWDGLLKDNGAWLASPEWCLAVAAAYRQKPAAA